MKKIIKKYYKKIISVIMALIMMTIIISSAVMSAAAPIIFGAAAPLAGSVIYADFGVAASAGAVPTIGAAVGGACVIAAAAFLLAGVIGTAVEGDFTWKSLMANYSMMAQGIVTKLEPMLSVLGGDTFTGLFTDPYNPEWYNNGEITLTSDQLQDIKDICSWFFDNGGYMDSNGFVHCGNIAYYDRIQYPVCDYNYHKTNNNFVVNWSQYLANKWLFYTDLGLYNGVNYMNKLNIGTGDYYIDLYNNGTFPQNFTSDFMMTPWYIRPQADGMFSISAFGSRYAGQLDWGVAVNNIVRAEEFVVNEDGVNDTYVRIAVKSLRDNSVVGNIFWDYDAPIMRVWSDFADASLQDVFQNCTLTVENTNTNGTLLKYILKKCMNMDVPNEFKTGIEKIFYPVGDNKLKVTKTGKEAVPVDKTKVIKFTVPETFPENISDLNPDNLTETNTQSSNTSSITSNQTSSETSSDITWIPPIIPGGTESTTGNAIDTVISGIQPVMSVVTGFIDSVPSEIKNVFVAAVVLTVIVGVVFLII